MFKKGEETVLKRFLIAPGVFSLRGILYYIYLKIRRRSILVAGTCRGCGTCCRRISLEGPHGWLRSNKKFATLADKNPDYSRFAIIGKDSDGFLLFACSWLTADGVCQNYENRLALCRNFPESSLVFAGGRLPSGCGYRFAEVVPFASILKKEISKYQ